MYIKTCTLCKSEKLLDEFSTATREKDGKQPRCKSCNSSVAAAYRNKNREKERVRHKIYIENNREKRREYEREYNKKNRDKIRAKAKKSYNNHCEKSRARSKKSYQKNTEARKTYSKEWRARNLKHAKHYDAEYCRNNKAKFNAKNSKRRAAIMQALVLWSETSEIIRLYAECTRKTKETGIIHHVDHIIPLKSNLVCGLHCLANLRIVTQKENLAKCNRFISGSLDEVFA
jgi:hypothetical protein